ncbi:unnamed protein product [Protopolystoma xenopodis]|uniref:Uncharacterized protein n=1 Tax=Protopolystoma xenopodis TaxID=117903 RepID=A0A3S5CGY1_9PLAT|nr:unnamed protein product [Protopolystoma xenopodis]
MDQTTPLISTNIRISQKYRLMNCQVGTRTSRSRSMLPSSTVHDTFALYFIHLAFAVQILLILF